MRYIAFAAIAFTSGCASIGTQRDPLCAEIVRFANATEAGTQRRIELCTDWGDRCADAPAEPSTLIFASASCVDGGYEPGKQLCQYLIGHTEKEFPSNNFSSVLVCLAPYSPERYGDYEWEHAAVRSSQMRGLNEGVSVGVEFVMGSNQEPAMLKVDAKADLPAFPDDIVRARLVKEVGSRAPITTGAGACPAAQALPRLKGAAFNVTYPDGVFIVCDARISGNRATATILHYLFNASRDAVLAAGSIDVKLAKRGSNWRISEWSKAAIDYAL